MTEQQNNFSYTYSAKDHQEVLNIREKYLTQPESELDALKALDTKVRRPANVVAYLYGSLSAMVMGAGMSLVMTEVGSMIGMDNTMLPGIVIGIVGLVMALTTYLIYKKLLNARKKKYAPEIVALSETIMNG